MKAKLAAPLGALLLWGIVLCEQAPGAITLVNATATVEQADAGNSYLISRAIDGNTSSGTQGWATFPGQGTAQTAVFQTSALNSDAAWDFDLFFSHFATGHKIQQFRISATTSLSPTTTSGATWTELTPSLVSGTWGGGPVTYSVTGNTVRFSGVNEPGNGSAYVARWTMTALNPSLTNVTGFRLEVFPFDDNGAGGPTLGFQTGSNNGNIVLTEFTATTVPEPSRALLVGTGLIGLIFRRRRCG